MFLNFAILLKSTKQKIKRRYTSLTYFELINKISFL